MPRLSSCPVRAGCQGWLEPRTPALQQEPFLPSCTDVPHNGKRGEALCYPAEEATASQRLMILRVESFLMPLRHYYKNRPPPLWFPASSASPRWHIKARVGAELLLHPAHVERIVFFKRQFRLLPTCVRKKTRGGCRNKGNPV